MDQLVKYDITDAAIAKMSEIYMDLTVKDVDDGEGFKAVHDARMVVKGKRVDVEKKRKELKADALKWGKTVDAEAKRITALLNPIEAHLQQEEDIVIAEQTRIKEEKERKEREETQARIDELAKYDVSMPFFEISALSDAEYQTILDAAIQTHAEAEAQKAEEERQRKKKEKAEEARLEADRQALKRQGEQQAEAAAKLKAEQEELKHEQDKANAKIQAEHAKIEAEKKALEDEKRKVAAIEVTEDLSTEDQDGPGEGKWTKALPPKEATIGHEYIIEDTEGELGAEIILYTDGEIEIGLSDKHCGLTYYVNVNDFEKALLKARAKLDI